MQPDNLYFILGLPDKTNNIEEIKNAYRKLAKKYHPDLNNGIISGKWQSIQDAYFILIDDQKRKAYNESGFIPYNNNELLREMENFLKSFFEELFRRDESIFELNIIESINKTCNQNIIMAEKEIKNLKKQLKFIEKFKKKFKKKKPINNDIINKIFVEKIEIIKNKLRILYHNIEVFKATKVYINDYEFDFTKFLEGVATNAS